MAFADTDARPLSQLNVTPLIDVMMVLLVIFMVTAPLLETGLTLNLPQRGPTPPIPPETIRLSIDDSGAVHWNGIPMSRAVLASAFRAEAARDPQPVLQLDSADGVQYATVAAVLADARHAGLDQIGLPLD